MIFSKKALFPKLFLSMLLAFCVSGSTVLTSCTKKVGCPVNEQKGPRTNKNGTLSMKKGKSNLFSKKQRRKMR